VRRRGHSCGNGRLLDLTTEGAETELDKTVIDRLGDPLVHLIRNCCLAPCCPLSRTITR
jgi:Asp/Glu/hydantoin racemase